MTANRPSDRPRTTRWRRAVAAAAAVGLLATGMALAPTAASALPGCSEYWDSSGPWSGAPAAGGTGTVGDPYQVGDRADLEMVAFCPDSHFRQISDIALAGPFVTLGTLTGSYDGGSHTISDLFTVPGLFEAVDSGEVKDLNLTQVQIIGPERLGALAGGVYGEAKITGINASGTVTGDADSQYVGGIVGEISEAPEPPVGELSIAATGPQLSGLTWNGTVSGSQGVGGIAGMVLAGTLTQAEATGEVAGIPMTEAPELSIGVGGIAGLIDTAQASELAVNQMAVSGSLFVGGITGALYDGATLTDSQASVVLTGDGFFNGGLGGIAGVTDGASLARVAVTADTSVTAGVAVGGIVGIAEAGTLTDVESAATVTATTPEDDGYGGGIAGALLDMTVSKVRSTGATQSPVATGGIAGEARASTVSDASATGPVSGQLWAGGLIGNADHTTVTRSTATGDVTGIRVVGGLVGGVFPDATTITDSSASGKVSATGSAGGLVGEMSGVISRSSASGAVTTTEDAAGGLIGVLLPVSFLCPLDDVQACSAADDVTTTQISTSFASGKVTGRRHVGGLVGQLPGALCLDVTAQAGDCVLPGAANAVDVLDTYATGEVRADSAAGGLIGSTADYTPPIVTGNNATIQQERLLPEGRRFDALRSLLGRSLSSGVAVESLGELGSTAVAIPAGVASSYASGAVTASSDVGGLVGLDTGSLTVTESFWDSTANPAISGGTGTPKTQAQLRDITTFSTAGWKIQNGAPASGDNVWGICVPPDPAVHNGYPFLLWQHPASNPCHPVPAAPVLKSLTPGDRTLGVTAELGADGGNPVSKVQYRLDGGEWIDSGGATGSFTIGGLVNGRTYTVQVRAINAIGASEPSNELAGTPTAVTPATTVLKVKGLPGGKKLKVGKRNVLVQSVRTNGALTVARVFCTLKGNRLPPRLRDRLCAPTVNRATATSGASSDVTAAAKTRKKKLRITAKPDCSSGLKVHVKVAAKAKGAKRKIVTRSYRVANNPAVKCRIKGTG